MRPATEVMNYFKEAAAWDADRLEGARRSARTAWRVAGAGWICAMAAAVALGLAMPLKRIEPFLIRVDRSTGIVDVVPVFAGAATVDQNVTRYFLTHYVTVCERFNYATAESDYEECGAFHTARLNEAWSARWNQTNPKSPLNVHKDGSSVHVQVESVSFFKRGSGVSDLAQVRYRLVERESGGHDAGVTHWIATIQYGYGKPSQDVRTRGWNPLGFKIIRFDPEPEVLPATPPVAVR